MTRKGQPYIIFPLFSHEIEKSKKRRFHVFRGPYWWATTKQCFRQLFAYACTVWWRNVHMHKAITDNVEAPHFWVALTRLMSWSSWRSPRRLTPMHLSQLLDLTTSPLNFCYSNLQFLPFFSPSVFLHEDRVVVSDGKTKSI